MSDPDRKREVDERLDALYRRMSPADKVRKMMGLTALAHSLALAQIRSQYPHESPRQHRLRLASRWIPRAQMIAAFGWDPEAKR